ncbi:MAG: hydroxymethylpyrimidine/phosphomethylpyrimidine kinase [Candidatus Aminicenantes bacterium]|nr:hydroxymethylpyrimidine/phosphomethylpyrimidine kinase [Candidatus Aminicenantes bacterium]
MLLTVAGFDPSGGAGLILDLQVFRSLGFQGTAVVTALTSQNIQRVFEVKALPPSFVRSQYQALKKDFSWEGMKVGLIGNRSLLPIIKEILEELANRPRVIDPIFQASSGACFLDPKAIPDFLKTIAERASVITPNLHEASTITGLKIKTVEDMEKAAKRIYEMTGLPCLLKGGHRPGRIFDLLYTERKVRIFESPRQAIKVHGTGCFLSASLLAYLVLKKDLEKACAAALLFTQKAIKKAIKPHRGRAFFSFLN